MGFRIRFHTGSPEDRKVCRMRLGCTQAVYQDKLLNDSMQAKFSLVIQASALLSLLLSARIIAESGIALHPDRGF